MFKPAKLFPTKPSLAFLEGWDEAASGMAFQPEHYAITAEAQDYERGRQAFFAGLPRDKKPTIPSGVLP